MPTCFVMQPFDGGPFDMRFDEVFAPAIIAAGLEPYRVDQDPKVSVPIQEIEVGIRDARVCLADITLDNPNVWFELGFAIACKKEVVLVCSEARTTKFPFDVQHRTIIMYNTASPSEFDKLRAKITQKLHAYLEKSEALATVSEVSQLTTPTAGFADHEVVALAVLAQNLAHEDDSVSMYQIRRDMESSGFTRVAATLAIKLLLNKQLIDSQGCTDQNGEPYVAYRLTERGWSWLIANQEKFALTAPSPSTGRKPTGKKNAGDFDDDIPF